MDRQSKPQMNNGIASPRKNIGKENKSPTKSAVSQHAATTIPDNSVVLVRKYIIYENPRDESKNTDVELNATTKSVNNNILLGENIEQNSRNEGEKNENNKSDAVKNGDQAMEKEENGDVKMEMEEDEEEEDGMSWPELFAWQLMNANRGELIKEEDVPMISTNGKELLKEYIDFKK